MKKFIIKKGDRFQFEAWPIIIDVDRIISDSIVIKSEDTFDFSGSVNFTLPRNGKVEFDISQNIDIISSNGEEIFDVINIYNTPEKTVVEIDEKFVIVKEL